MAVYIHCYIGVLVVGVLIMRAVLFGLYTRPPGALWNCNCPDAPQTAYVHSLDVINARACIYAVTVRNMSGCTGLRGVRIASFCGPDREEYLAHHVHKHMGLFR